MAWLCLLLLLGSCPLSSLFSMPEVMDHPAPRYKINLDLPLGERWQDILKDYNATELQQEMNHLLSSMINEKAKSSLLLMADVYLDFFAPNPYAGEMRGIAKALGLKTSEVVLINLLYELVMACTSIIAEDKDGYIHHGRNMDMDFPSLLRKVTLDVDFIRNGQVAYTGSTFVGFVGLYTGQRPHKFSISANAREDNQNLFKNALSLMTLRSPASWLIRNTLDSAPDYESAVAQLSNEKIAAEIYFTVAGTKPGEGVAITRNRNGLAHILHLNTSDGRWFLIQTNFDVDSPKGDRRMNVSIQSLNSIGQAHISKDAIYEVLSTWPVKNWATIHTTTLSAASPQDYESIIRHRKAYLPPKFRPIHPTTPSNRSFIGIRRPWPTRGPQEREALGGGHFRFIIDPPLEEDSANKHETVHVNGTVPGADGKNSSAVNGR